MNYIRSALQPMEAYIRHDAREHRRAGVAMLYGHVEDEAKEELATHATQADIASMHTAQPVLLELLLQHEIGGLLPKYSEEKVKITRLSTEVGAVSVLGYFNNAHRVVAQNNRSVPALPRIEVETIFSAIYDGRFSIPFRWNHTNTDITTYLARWTTRDPVYNLASNVTRMLVERSGPAYVLLGDHFDMSSFCFGAMMSGIGVIEEAGNLHRQITLPRRYYKA